MDISIRLAFQRHCISMCWMHQGLTEERSWSCQCNIFSHSRGSSRCDGLPGQLTNSYVLHTMILVTSSQLAYTFTLNRYIERIQARLPCLPWRLPCLSCRWWSAYFSCLGVSAHELVIYASIYLVQCSKDNRCTLILSHLTACTTS